MLIKTPDGRGEDDKVIGIIGVAPWSSIDFLNALYTQIKATKDWHYPRVICDINTKIPSRGRHFDLGEEDFSPYIKKNIVNLKEQGAEIVIVACNTAHIYFDKWGGVDGVQILHIVDECIGEIKRINAKKIAFLSGYALWKIGMYQEKINLAGLDLCDLNEKEATLIYEIILDIKKSNKIKKERQTNVEHLFESLKLRGVDTLLLGCTELSSIHSLAKKYFQNVVDSNIASARAIINKSIKRKQNG